MYLTQTAQYAVRALLLIASRTPKSVRVGEIATRIAAPVNYLSKILHQLVRAELLVSSRGPTGGYRLAVPEASITLRCVASVYSAPTSGHCLLRQGQCGAAGRCEAHERWITLVQPMDAFFNTTTLADLRHHPRPTLVTSPPLQSGSSTRGSVQ
ncbi:Rrf2 family transcriptional regulator [soil metagenome]